MKHILLLVKEEKAEAMRLESELWLYSANYMWGWVFKITQSLYFSFKEILAIYFWHCIILLMWGNNCFSCILIHKDNESSFLWFQDLWKLFGTKWYHLHIPLRTLKRCISSRAPLICDWLSLKCCILMDFCYLAVVENCYRHMLSF